MLKFLTGQPDAKPAPFTLAGALALDGAELIPVECGGRLAGPGPTVNQLGKQLLRAAAVGDADGARALLSQGALFTADWLGTSPLHLAARHDHLEICELLLKAGISRDARTKVDKTALHVAAQEGHANVVEALLDHGCDPDCRDLLGMTPLHWAAQNGHADVVRVLVHGVVQTGLRNKYDLTAAEIAAQLGRLDIVELIQFDVDEPMTASQHLTLELIENNGELSTNPSPIPLETILMEGNDKFQIGGDDAESEVEANSFAESIKILQEHGITMLPQDESNILTTVMETGHSVVLTDVGKQVLNTFKQSDDKTNAVLNKKIITVTPEEFLSMTNGGNGQNKNILKQINGRLVPKNVKRIVMKKNKVVPVSSINNVFKVNGSNSGTDMETVMTQLIEARKTIEEYKLKLTRKEKEAERYKQQLTLLMNSS